MTRIIVTDRLILRPLDENDAEDVFEWVGDPIVNRYMQYSVYKDIEQVKKWLEQAKNKDYEFGFALKETGKVIGAGSVTLVPEQNAYELGYNLNRAFWRKGYATEAAKAMIGWAYDTLGARDFTATHANANTASGNVIRKCGFQFEKYGKYSKFDESEVFDASCYRLHLD
ncbi:MAG: GNAT family N-acetyltransferase [Eubacterium sp.]|nr:GNAT family N-acetyltransferase [Eubacterium sp.]